MFVQTAHLSSGIKLKIARSVACPFLLRQRLIWRMNRFIALWWRHPRLKHDGDGESPSVGDCDRNQLAGEWFGRVDYCFVSSD